MDMSVQDTWLTNHIAVGSVRAVIDLKRGTYTQAQVNRIVALAKPVAHCEQLDDITILTSGYSPARDAFMATLGAEPYAGNGRYRITKFVSLEPAI